MTVVTRNVHQKGLNIKSSGNQGWIEVVEANIFDEKKIRKLFESADICINLVGILFEKKAMDLLKLFILYFHPYYLNFVKSTN